MTLSDAGISAVRSDVTITELIEDKARRQPDELAFTFIDYDVDPDGITESLTWAELHQRVQVVAAQLAKEGSPGDRAVILAPQSLEYIVGFFGAIQAGFIAVPLSMPAPGQHDERAAGVMADCTPVAVLTTSAVVDDLRAYIQAQPGQRAPRMIAVDALDYESPVKPAEAQPITKIAYLQYTSGSTRAPRGVEITHHTRSPIWTRCDPTIWRTSAGRRPTTSPWSPGCRSTTTWD